MKEEKRGKKCKCPGCGSHFIVPPGPKTPKSSDSTTSSDSLILISCKCGKQLSAKKETAGKKSRCPNCGSYFSIPSKPNSLTDAESKLGESRFPDTFLKSPSSTHWSKSESTDTGESDKDVLCPKCDRSLRIPFKAFGKNIKCPCGQILSTKSLLSDNNSGNLEPQLSQQSPQFNHGKSLVDNRFPPPIKKVSGVVKKTFFNNSLVLFDCPYCSISLDIEHQNASKPTTCPNCGNSLLVQVNNLESINESKSIPKKSIVLRIIMMPLYLVIFILGVAFLVFAFFAFIALAPALLPLIIAYHVLKGNIRATVPVDLNNDGDADFFIHSR